MHCSNEKCPHFERREEMPAVIGITMFKNGCPLGPIEQDHCDASRRFKYNGVTLENQVFLEIKGFGSGNREASNVVSS